MTKKTCKKAARLYAVPHDDTMDGDNTFWCPDPVIPYKEGMTLADIRQIWGEMSDMADYADEMTGAWLIDEKCLKACQAVWGEGPTGDSDAYALNRAAKRIACQMAIRDIRS